VSSLFLSIIHRFLTGTDGDVRPEEKGGGREKEEKKERKGGGKEIEKKPTSIRTLRDAIPWRA